MGIPVRTCPPQEGEWGWFGNGGEQSGNNGVVDGLNAALQTVKAAYGRGAARLTIEPMIKTSRQVR